MPGRFAKFDQGWVQRREAPQVPVQLPPWFRLSFWARRDCILQWANRAPGDGPCLREIRSANGVYLGQGSFGNPSSAGGEFRTCGSPRRIVARRAHLAAGQQLEHAPPPEDL